MMKRIIYLILAISLAATARSQPPYNFSINGQFNEFVTYYISSIDINTGASDVQLFFYELGCDDCPTGDDGRYLFPVEVNVEFSIAIESPALGIDEEIAFLYTDRPFEIYAPVQLDNRDFTIDALEIRDIYGDEISIDVSTDDDRTATESQMTDIMNSIVTTGRLPDGVYSFVLDIDVTAHDSLGAEIPFNDPYCPDCQRSLTVTTPVSLELAYGNPGGTWGDLDQNEIYTTFPVFNWESDLVPSTIMDNCIECGFYIRVAEFRADDHSSIDDAIEDLTSLPVDQAAGWYYVGNQLSMMYPPSDAIELYPGGVYVYQVQKRIITTVGIEELESPVYVFSIANVENPYMEYLKDIIGEPAFEAFFDPGGELSGYGATGVVTLDGNELNQSDVIDLKNQFYDGVYQVSNMEAE